MLFVAANRRVQWVVKHYLNRIVNNKIVLFHNLVGFLSRVVMGMHLFI